MKKHNRRVVYGFVLVCWMRRGPVGGGRRDAKLSCRLRGAGFGALGRGGGLGSLLCRGSRMGFGF